MSWKSCSRLICTLALSAGLSAFSGSAYAQTSSDEIQSLKQRLEQAEAQIRMLQQQLQQQRQAQVAAQTSATTVSPAQMELEARLAALEQKLASAPPKDEGVDTTKEKFSVKVGGRIYYDSTWGGDEGLEDTALGRNFQNGHEFRTGRIKVEGKGYGIFSYRIQVDLAHGGVTLKDLYIGASDTPVGNIKVGHFKEPFSLEELTSSRFITFMERALPNAMVPGRSIGWMVYDTYADEMGTWAVGTFFDDFQQTPASHDGNVDNDDNEARSITARVTRLLYYDECTPGRALIHIGSSFRWNDAEPGTRLRIRARPEIHDTFRVLGLRTYDADYYWQWGAEAAAVYGPASVQAEYIATYINNDTQPDPYLWGCYVYASYFLTGENRVYERHHGAFGRVKPNENFWWVNGPCPIGLGAWELALRWSYLDFDDSGITPEVDFNGEGTTGELWNLTAGVNWYWTPQARMMFNYVHSDLSDAVTGNDADIDAFMTRIQVDY